MAAVEKFMFETRFDNVEAHPDRHAPPPAKTDVTLSEDELAAVREESFAAGRAEGAAEARAAAETLAAQSLEKITDCLRTAAAEMTPAIDAIKRDAAAAAITAVRKLVPHLSKEGDLADIEAVVASCLSAVLEEPRVAVRINDSLLDPLKERIADVAAKAGYDGKVVLVADDNLSPGDCRVEWADGGAERDTGWMWKQIDGVVQRFFAGLTVTPPQAPPPDETPQAAGPESGPATPGPDMPGPAATE